MRAGQVLICAAAAITLVSGVRSQTFSQSSASLIPPNVVTYVADLTSSGATIPADFVGFSFEVGTTGLLSGYFTGASTSLSGLIGLIGVNGVLRFGGGTSDTPTTPNLTSGIVSDLQAFLSLLGSGWTTIYGLDINANNSALAATQAQMLINTLGANKVVLQMGNEPGQGNTPNYSIPTYESRWNAYYSAINGLVFGARYAAIDGSSFLNMPTIVDTLTPGPSGMALLTQHWYPFANPPGISTNPSLLSNAFYPPLSSDSSFIGTTATTLAGLFALNTSFAATNGVGQRLTETNMVAGGGQAGLTNTLINSTWIINLGITMARAGWKGFNVHGDNGASHYSPVVQQLDGGWSPGPIFYGMYLLAQIEGQQIVPVSQPGNANNAPNSMVIGVKGQNGQAAILVSNQEISKTLTVTPGQSSAWTTAKVLTVAGAGCLDPAPTLGGQPIGESGAWIGAPYSINKGQTVTLGPCEAALISIQP